MEQKTYAKSRSNESVAQALLEGPLAASDGPGVYKIGGRWIRWVGYRWVPVTAEDVYDEILREMGNVVVRQETSQGVSELQVSMNPNRAKDLQAIIGAICKLPVQGLPYSAPTLNVERDWTVAVGDTLVTATLDGIRTSPRTSEWVHTVGTSFEYDADAECPVWMETIEQWSRGEDAWTTLLGRLMGAAIVPYRDWQRMVFLAGKVRGGKGVIMRLLRDMLGPWAMMSRSLEDLVDSTGTWGADVASILFVDEVQDMDNSKGEKASGIFKRIIGQSPIRIQEKYVPAFEVKSPAMVWMSANQLPNLPDKGSGLSSKMLVLPFTVSFLGREDFELEDKLRAELPGIFNWAMNHLIDLRRAAAEKRYSEMWPDTEEGLKIKDQYRLMANQFDLFLETHFVKSTEGGHVAKAEVRSLYETWARKNRIPPIPRNHVIARLLRETSWDIYEGTRPDGVRVVRRLLPKKKKGSSLDD